MARGGSASHDLGRTSGRPHPAFTFSVWKPTAKPQPGASCASSNVNAGAPGSRNDRGELAHEGRRRNHRRRSRRASRLRSFSSALQSAGIARQNHRGGPTPRETDHPGFSRRRCADLSFGNDWAHPGSAHRCTAAPAHASFSAVGRRAPRDSLSRSAAIRRRLVSTRIRRGAAQGIGPRRARDSAAALPRDLAKGAANQSTFDGPVPLERAGQHLLRRSSLRRADPPLHEGRSNSRRDRRRLVPGDAPHSAPCHSPSRLDGSRLRDNRGRIRRISIAAQCLWTRRRAVPALRNEDPPDPSGGAIDAHLSALPALDQASKLPVSSSRRNALSSKIGIPKERAFSSFEPALSPLITALVFLLTLSATRAPRTRNSSCA